MATMFPQTLGAPPQVPAFVDPYAQQIEAARARLAQQQLAPMFTPEQAAQRRAQNSREYELGLLGSLSGDDGVKNIGGQVFKQALAARQPRVTERGVADPITGQFNYDPDFLRQRDEAALSGLEQRSAQERARFDAGRLSAADKAEQQRQRAEDQRELRGLMNSGASASKQGQQDARIWRAEDSMRGDFDRITKDTREELGAVQKLKTTISGYAGRPMDGQAQQAVVILLNKFLDPGSVVREGEFDRVVKAQGLEALASNYINRLRTGEFMTPKAIADIHRLAQVYEAASEAKLRQVAANYTDIASRRGLDAGAVVSDPRWRPAPAADAGAGIDVGAALGRTSKPKALPKSNSKPSGPNRVVETDW